MQIAIFKRKSLPHRPYPRQFWLLFWGLFVMRSSMSMIWPFLTIFMRQKLDVPLTTVTLLMSVQAVASLVSTTAVSSLMDRVGRKLAMVLSLFFSAITLVGMASFDQLEVWVILIALYGALNPVFTVGVNTMVADLIEPQARSSAYALTRMIGNAGIAIGPVIGGTLAQFAFELVYLTTAFILALLACLVGVFIAETMPTDGQSPVADAPQQGYGFILRDWLFISFFATFMLVELTNTQVFTLLPVYTVENFGLKENEYSLLLTVNASMVVLLQFSVTRWTARFRPMRVMGVGALFYMAGTYSIVWGEQLGHFILSMVIITIGELIILPTATTLTADLAPPHMRARYMGIFWLAYPVASGVGPVIGGYLSDTIGPKMIWYSASVIAGMAAVGFFALAQARQWKRKRQAG